MRLLRVATHEKDDNNFIEEEEGKQTLNNKIIAAARASTKAGRMQASKVSQAVIYITYLTQGKRKTNSELRWIFGCSYYESHALYIYRYLAFSCFGCVSRRLERGHSRSNGAASTPHSSPARPARPEQQAPSHGLRFPLPNHQPDTLPEQLRGHAT